MKLILTFLLKKLNNAKSSILVDVSTLNHDHKIDTIHLIWNEDDLIPLDSCSSRLGPLGTMIISISN
jgi:hypothetical protein